MIVKRKTAFLDGEKLFENDFDENGNIVHSIVYGFVEDDGSFNTTITEYWKEFNEDGYITHCTYSDGLEEWFDYSDKEKIKVTNSLGESEIIDIRNPEIKLFYQGDFELFIYDDSVEIKCEYFDEEE